MKKIKFILTHMFLLFGLLIVITPIYITVVNSMKDREETAKNFFALPNRLNFSNYIQVIEKDYFQYVLNSFSIVLGGLLLILIVLPMVSYAIARNMNNNKYYKILYFFIIIGMFIPFQVKMLSVVQIMSDMNLTNNYGLMILYCAGALTQGTFLTVNYIKMIPIELEEAGYVEGGTAWTIFVKIALPLMKPILATLVIINGLWIWNDFLMPLLILNQQPDMWTLPLFQFNFKTQYSFDYNLAFASFLLAMAPVMIVYPFLQKEIVGGLTTGAVKD